LSETFNRLDCRAPHVNDDTKVLQVLNTDVELIIFLSWALRPYPHLISFSLLRGKEKEIQDKEKETRRLHTVAKFNSRFANSSLCDWWLRNP